MRRISTKRASGASSSTAVGREYTARADKALAAHSQEPDQLSVL